MEWRDSEPSDDEHVQQDGSHTTSRKRSSRGIETLRSFEHPELILLRQHAINAEKRKANAKEEVQATQRSVKVAPYLAVVS